MTWEEIIIAIRKDPAFSDLVKEAYFDEDLLLNAGRFENSEEFLATLAEIKIHHPAARKLADIGAGNGIASVAFAKNGFEVTAVEPDPSSTIGSGAIRILKEQLRFAHLHIVDAFGESLPCENETFDVVYVRQAMHHAADLPQFVNELARILKKGGILFTTRDHVILDEKDKQWFLETHPLHKFYGGENAFTVSEYTQAIKNAGLEIKKQWGHFDHVINYSPETSAAISEKRKTIREKMQRAMQKKTGPLSKIPFLLDAYISRTEKKYGPLMDERKIPGRLYSFIAVKK